MDKEDRNDILFDQVWGLGIITISVASMVFNISNWDIEFEEYYNVVAPTLGVRLLKPIILEEDRQYTPEELMLLTVSQLKDICHSYGQKVTGNKEDLIGRVLEGRVNKETTNAEFLIKNKLMSIWFMAPVKNTAMKIGQQCEHLIANKIPQFALKKDKLKFPI